MNYFCLGKSYQKSAQFIFISLMKSKNVNFIQVHFLLEINCETLTSQILWQYKTKKNFTVSIWKLQRTVCPLHYHCLSLHFFLPPSPPPPLTLSAFKPKFLRYMRNCTDILTTKIKGLVLLPLASVAMRTEGGGFLQKVVHKMWNVTHLRITSETLTVYEPRGALRRLAE